MRLRQLFATFPSAPSVSVTHRVRSRVVNPVCIQRMRERERDRERGRERDIGTRQSKGLVRWCVCVCVCMVALFYTCSFSLISLPTLEAPERNHSQ